MFISIYIYRVPRENVDAFLLAQGEAATIYRQHGALDDETYAAINLDSEYGCAGFVDAFDIKDDEKVFIGFSRFRDRAHHDEVMTKVDSDQRINQLYDKVTTLLDVRRVVRGEFERVI